MTINEVVNKLTFEMVLLTGHTDDAEVYRKYINMALLVGIEHFTIDMEEIIALDHEGVERGRFKGIRDAARKLGLKESSISNVIAGRNHSTGGYIFIKNKDKYLISV